MTPKITSNITPKITPSCISCFVFINISLYFEVPVY